MATSDMNTVIDNLKSMGWAERLDYIWTYFKLQILFVVVGIILLSILFGSFLAPKAVLQIVALNTDTVSSVEETFEPFLKQYGYKTGKDSVIFDQAIIVDPTDDAYLEEIMPFVMRFANPQDLFVGSGAMYENIIENNIGLLTDLREFLPQEQLDQLELLYTDDGGEVDPYPCAVLVKANSVFVNDCYVGICFSTEHPQAALDFLTYLLSL